MRYEDYNLDDKEVDWGQWTQAQFLSIIRSAIAVSMLEIADITNLTEGQLINPEWAQRVGSAFEHASANEALDSLVEISPAWWAVIFLLIMIGIWTDNKDGQLARASHVKDYYPGIASIGAFIDHAVADMPFIIATLIYAADMLPNAVKVLETLQSM